MSPIKWKRDTHNKLSSYSGGFSLIELLVVLVILGLLAAVVAPNVMNKLGGAKSKTTALQIQELTGALDMYALDVGHYPSSDEGLSALINNAKSLPKWTGPYLKKTVLPKDGWGNDFHYKFPGQHNVYDLYSLGADKTAGGEGENADINSWE